MSTEHKPPVWAFTRVVQLTEGYWGRDTAEAHPVTKAFARYIAEHEEAPVDPLAKEMAGAIHHFFPNDLRLYQSVYGDPPRAAEQFIADLQKRGIVVRMADQ